MTDVEAKLFDVVAVNIETLATRHIAQGKSERNAEAIIMMAVGRRGVDDEYYKRVPAGTSLEDAIAYDDDAN